MDSILIFSICLLIAALISDIAGRTVLSISGSFLIVGTLCSTFGILRIQSMEVVSILADTALVAVLYTDAAKIGVYDLVRAWHLPGRALLLGMPLTFFGTALLAHFVSGLDWQTAFLIGAVLSPTDPVFASALVGSERIPQTLRHLLNVESGVNDGLALPLVMYLLSSVTHTEISVSEISSELIIGVFIGVGIAGITVALERTRYFATSHTYVPLLGFAVILVVYSVSKMLHANEFLGAFAAGVSVASMKSNLQDRFFKFIGALSEILKLGALFVFGGLVSFHFWRDFKLGEILFAVLAIVAVRPLAIGIALLGSDLSWKERVVAGWFGPKGFASVVFGLLIFNSNAPQKEHLFHLIALVVAGSILLLSSTDVLAQKWLSSSEVNQP